MGFEQSQAEKQVKMQALRTKNIASGSLGLVLLPISVAFKRASPLNGHYKRKKA